MVLKKAKDIKDGDTIQLDTGNYKVISVMNRAVSEYIDEYGSWVSEVFIMFEVLIGKRKIYMEFHVNEEMEVL